LLGICLKRPCTGTGANQFFIIGNGEGAIVAFRSLGGVSVEFVGSVSSGWIPKGVPEDGFAELESTEAVDGSRCLVACFREFGGHKLALKLISVIRGLVFLALSYCLYFIDSQ
jgi:hypothetical protein